MHSATALESTGCADSATAKRKWPSTGGAAADVEAGTIWRDIADRNADVARDCLREYTRILKRIRHTEDPGGAGDMQNIGRPRK